MSWGEGTCFGGPGTEETFPLRRLELINDQEGTGTVCQLGAHAGSADKQVQTTQPMDCTNSDKQRAIG